MNNLTRKMIEQASHALQHAYAPYSNYRVGACICTEEDALFTGVNVENSSYGLTICAESSAICQMVAAGQYKIKSMVLLAGNNMLCTPCGACRQRMCEFSTPHTQIFLCNQQTILKSITMEDLLPMAFSLKKS